MFNRLMKGNILKLSITDYVLFISLLVILIYKFSLLNYGNPYLFHPDEPYILKDPFKLINNYVHLDFSAPSNLLNWLILFWYGIVFIIGYVFGEWSSTHDFIQMLIGEDFKIIFYARVLSFIFCLGAYYYLYKTFKLAFSSFRKSIIVLMLFVLNPVELISTMWLKFDSAAFLMTAIIINYSHQFIIQKNNEYRGKLYFIILIALSLRIDFIAFFIALVLYEIFSAKKLRTYINSLILIKKSLIQGVVAYSLITLFFVPVIYNNFFKVADLTATTTAKPFNEAIFGLMVKNIKSGMFLESVWNHFMFYFFNISIVVLLPVFVGFIYFSVINFRRHFFLLLAASIYFAASLLSTHQAPHYFLVTSTIMFYIVFMEYKTLSNKTGLILISGCFIYLGTLYFGVVYQVLCKTDTRILAKDFILINTTSNDIIAIDGYENYGYYPIVNECEEALETKAKVIMKSKTGTGESFMYKIKKNKGEACRNIYEIAYLDRFKNTELEGKLINSFDTVLLANVNPKMYVSNEFNMMYNLKFYAGYKDFYSYIKQNYSLIKEFDNTELIDMRLKFFLFNENFFPHFYIFEKKNN